MLKFIMMFIYIFKYEIAVI